MQHATFIDDLGGPTSVAIAINARLRVGITSQAVSNWKRRGIPFKYRGTLTVLAQEKEVDTPADFFGIAGTG